MSRCSYCSWGAPKHGEECPETKKGQEREVAISDYRRGRDRGRQGLEREEGQSRAYGYGYGNGVVALEEAENGFNPVHEGRQW